MKKMVMVLAIIGIFVATYAFAADMDSMMLVLKSTKQSIDSTFKKIDKDLKAAAEALSNIDLKSDAARKILEDLRKFRPYVVDCSIIDANGVKITVEPIEYKRYENMDRSDLPSVIELLSTKKPVMSDVYHAAEDINAISIGYPIFSENGELRGAVRMLIRQEALLKPLVENKPCKIWVMQRNGLIVYDADPEEISKNIFFDEMFKSFDDLISFAKTVALARTGAGSYSFYANGVKDKTLVEKIAAWDTVGIYGTEWRVVVMEAARTLEEPDKKPDESSGSADK